MVSLSHTLMYMCCSISKVKIIKMYSISTFHKSVSLSIKCHMIFSTARMVSYGDLSHKIVWNAGWGIAKYCLSKYGKIKNNLKINTYQQCSNKNKFLSCHKQILPLYARKSKMIHSLKNYNLFKTNFPSLGNK